MKICPNCHHETEDQALCCPVCGTVLDALGHIEMPYRKEQTPPLAAVYEPELETKSVHDHTEEYSKGDIEENKVLCMCVYLLDAVGIIIALLMSPHSPFTRFHITQSLKFTVLEALIMIASALLCWTVLVPILGALAMLLLLIFKLTCFVDVCRGKAIESPVLRAIHFLN